MSCENCQLIQRVEKAEKDIEELQRDRNEANVKYGKMETTLDYIKTAVDNLTKKIDQIAEAPTKRWNTIINTGISGVVAAIVAAIMGLIFLGR